MVLGPETFGADGIYNIFFALTTSINVHSFDDYLRRIDKYFAATGTNDQLELSLAGIAGDGLSHDVIIVIFVDKGFTVIVGTSKVIHHVIAFGAGN